MDLILLPDDVGDSLRGHYDHAFNHAVELFVASAFLTGWPDDIPLWSGCQAITVIVGMDFGITRKEACRAVNEWLPEHFRDRFFVAARTTVFHPKAIFWRERDDRCHAVIGSSNLTQAAFRSNVEVNARMALSAKSFQQVREWMQRLEELSDPVMGEWIDHYREMPRVPDLYPVHNAPVRAFARESGFRAPRGSTEGARYIALATWLRKLLRQAQSADGYPADNLAELDIYLWRKFRKKKP